MHPQLNELRTRLANHDWHFAMSDDLTVFQKGSSNWNRIHALVKTLGYDGERLLNAFIDINNNPGTGKPWTEFKSEPTGPRLSPATDNTWRLI